MSSETERLIHALAHPVLAALATLYARRRPEHRVIAVVFWACTIATVLRLLLAVPLDAHPAPYSGALLVAYYADNAAYALFPIAFAGAIAVHYARLPPRWVVLVWAATVVAFVVWKEATGRPSIQFHEWVAFSGAVVGAACVARSALAPVATLVRPGSAHIMLALLLCNDLVNVTIYEIDGLIEAWPAIRAVDLAVYTLVALGYCALFARDWHARWSLRRT